MKKGNHRGSEAAIPRRQLEVMERRARGESFRELALGLGISHTQARRDLWAALEHVADELADRATQLRALEYARLEAPVTGLVQKVLEGDVKAIGAWVRLSESRRKLLGLDIAVEGPQIHSTAEPGGVEPVRLEISLTSTREDLDVQLGPLLQALAPEERSALLDESLAILETTRAWQEHLSQLSAQVSEFIREVA